MRYFLSHATPRLTTGETAKRELSRQAVDVAKRNGLKETAELQQTYVALREAELDVSDKYPNDWSRDGKYVLYARGSELWFVTLPEQKSTLFLKAASTLKTGRFSPDGKRVAYASNESGKWEIYVTSFPDARGKWQVSSTGGEQPVWRGDGKELLYLAADDRLMAVPVTSGANFDAGTPVPLFQANPRELVATSEQRTYDVSKDGQRFLINAQGKQAETTSMSVVQSWAAKLNK